MATFAGVTSGAVVHSADLNQYANALNGTTGAELTILAVNNTTPAYQGSFPSAPTSDQTLYGGSVSGDAVGRLSAYVRGADGYGGFRAGAGASYTAHLYAQSGSWKIDESLTIATNLTVTGSATLGSLAVTGTTSLDGSAITTNGSGRFQTSGGLQVSGGGLIITSGFTSLDNGGVITDGSGNLTVTGTFAGVHTDTAGAAGIVPHDIGSAIEIKPSANSRGIVLAYRDSGGALHDAFTLNSAGAITATGNLTAASLTATGAVSGATGSFSGALSAASVALTGALSAAGVNSSSGITVTSGVTSLDNGAILTNGSGQLTLTSAVASSGQFGKAAAGDILDASGASGGSWYLKGPGGGGRIRFQPASGATRVAIVDTSGTQLIVNNGFQYGSGGADDAELQWSDDPTATGPGVVVCFAEDDQHAGKVVPCSHDDCPAAGVISTAPVGVKGGELVVDADGEEVASTDPRWRPLTMEGKVPVKIVGQPSGYRPNDVLVSAGNGRMRKWQAGDHWPRGVVVSTKTDAGHRALAADCVLAMISW